MKVATMRAAADLLRLMGVNATVEYPGSIEAEIATGVRLIGGDANETFGIDVWDKFGRVIRSYVSEIPSDSDSAQAVASYYKGVVNEETDNKRRDQADLLEEAIDAFWVVIANAYPEIETGDLDPIETGQFRQACERALKAWLFWNKPEVTK